MAKYRLLAGRHTDEKGREYKAEDIVSSNNDLVAMFPNKFEKLPTSRPQGPLPQQGRQAQREDLPEEDRNPELHNAQEDEEEPEEEETSADDSLEQNGEEDGEGKDVTQDVPGAEAGGLVVIAYDDNTWNIFDAAEPEDRRAPLNDKPLTSKNQVKKGVHKFAKS